MNQCQKWEGKEEETGNNNIYGECGINLVKEMLHTAPFFFFGGEGVLHGGFTASLSPLAFSRGEKKTPYVKTVKGSSYVH